MEKLKAAGGGARALEWVLAGMPAGQLLAGQPTRQMLIEQLVQSGLSRELAERTADAAVAEGGVSGGSEGAGVKAKQPAMAEEQAASIAYATMESRVRLEDLQDSVADRTSALGVAYFDQYPVALESAGLEAIDLIDTFPVLTGHFGYTRGDPSPGESRLVPFRDRNDNLVVYSELSRTEALFVRLAPTNVAGWLRGAGFELPDWTDARSAREALLSSCEIPRPGEPGENGTPGKALLELVHTYAHRFIRTAAVFAGIDRNALSELLVPLHAGFFVYAASRGDFVLGGLQALFERGLDRFVGELVHGDHRCALDPGCRRSGGACMACLHIGEPSCRYFNGHLSRGVLKGPNSYLASLGK